jgi:hypothetical protein
MVAVVIPTLNEVENLVFAFSTVSARVGDVEIKLRSSDAFKRMAIVPGPDMRNVPEFCRRRCVTLGHQLHFICLTVLEKLKGYDVIPA